MLKTDSLFYDIVDVVNKNKYLSDDNIITIIKETFQLSQEEAVAYFDSAFTYLSFQH